MQGVDRMFSHERDTMPGYENLDGDYHDLDDTSGHAGLVNSFQCEYQVQKNCPFSPNPRGKSVADVQAETWILF